MDLAKWAMAINAVSALSCWNLGLCVQRRDASLRSSPETAPVKHQEVTKEQQVKVPQPIDLEPRKFPVSLESSAPDFSTIAAAVSSCDAICRNGRQCYVNFHFEVQRDGKTATVT